MAGGEPAACGALLPARCSLGLHGAAAGWQAGGAPPHGQAALKEGDSEKPPRLPQRLGAAASRAQRWTGGAQASAGQRQPPRSNPTATQPGTTLLCQFRALFLPYAVMILFLPNDIHCDAE